LTFVSGFDIEIEELTISPYAKPLPQPLPGTERGRSLNPSPGHFPKRRGGSLNPSPERRGEESQTSPPALSGKGDGGLGRMRKVN